MSGFREQAIRDVAQECGMDMLAMKPSLYEEDQACASFRYAVAQRMRVLELEAQLKALEPYLPPDLPQPLWTDTMRKACAARQQLVRDGRLQWE